MSGVNFFINVSEFCHFSDENEEITNHAIKFEDNSDVNHQAVAK
jgi:hypothetical protein